MDPPIYLKKTQKPTTTVLLASPLPPPACATVASPTCWVANQEVTRMERMAEEVVEEEAVVDAAAVVAVAEEAKLGSMDVDLYVDIFDFDDLR